MKTSVKSILKITGIPVVVASLCCLAPVIIVLFGLGSVSLAASLADTLYGTYAWAFRIVGLALLALSLIWYLRREKGICTIDDAKRRRNEILNIVGIVLTVGVVGYFVWLYVVVEYAGKLLNIWS
mgnify:CR=1 FL=1